MKCNPNCAPGDIKQRAALEGYSGSTGECWRAGRILGRIHRQGILSGIRWRATRIDWRAALAGYSAGSTGELLWQTPGGIHWRATPGYSAGYLAASTRGRDAWWDGLDAALRDTRRDPRASSSGGILGRIHWPAAPAGYSAGSGGITELLWRDALASCSGGILGGRGVEASQTRIPT